MFNTIGNDEKIILERLRFSILIYISKIEENINEEDNSMKIIKFKKENKNNFKMIFLAEILPLLNNDNYKFYLDDEKKRIKEKERILKN
ncbi:hypothetical protein Mgra_00007060 [Meloidogyne graminicola]|uniref:Uncharacterized protein n=1 Tax=Meloidogyne graminicola TaxID=189291 RepID=A0A8S9ZK56_9BILA|nr:hypothetical protein Mgra_00007060 [Meloidogyne graminicola]